MTMGELLEALNELDEREAARDRPRKSAIDQASEAVDKAIEAIFCLLWIFSDFRRRPDATGKSDLTAAR